MEKNQKNTEILRSVWINGSMDSEEKVSEIIRKIVDFDMADSTKPICIFINSRGGQIDLMIKIRNLLLQNIKSPLITVGLLNIQSAACALMPCGHLRILVEGSEFLFHKASIVVCGSEAVRFNARDLISTAMSLKKSTETALGYCVMQRPEHTNPCKIDAAKLLELIESAPEEEYIINTKQAIKMGLADCVVKKINRIKIIEKKFSQTFKQKRTKK